jgi:hypothetical protein
MARRNYSLAHNGSLNKSIEIEPQLEKGDSNGSRPGRALQRVAVIDLHWLMQELQSTI